MNQVKFTKDLLYRSMLIRGHLLARFPVPGAHSLWITLWITCFLLGLASILYPTVLAAAPLLDSRVGGLAIIGPAAPHGASVFYNPATLILLPDHHIYFNSTLRWGVGWSTLNQIDPHTGAGLTDQPGARESLRELGPQFFLGLSSNLGTDSMNFGFSASTPIATRFSYLKGDSGHELFDPAQQGASRYHGLSLSLYHVYITAAASRRLFDKLTFGVSWSYVFGLVDMRFARDVAIEGGSVREAGEYAALDDCGQGQPCNYGADAAAEAIRLKGSSLDGTSFSAGFLVHPHPALDVGVSYISRAMSFGHTDITCQGDAWVRRSQAVLLNAQSDEKLGAVAQDLSGRGTIKYSLPDMVNLGATYRANERWQLSLQTSWIHFSVHDQLDIRLTGTEFRARPQIPDRLVHYRGFQDVFTVQLGATYKLLPGLELQGAMMLESSAVPTNAIAPDAIDAWKMDTFLAIRWSFAEHWLLSAGYGLVWMLPIDVGSSTFSPSTMTDCVDGRYDVELGACTLAASGHSLRDASGNYFLLLNRFALAFSWSY